MAYKNFQIKCVHLKKRHHNSMTQFAYIMTFKNVLIHFLFRSCAKSIHCYQKPHRGNDMYFNKYYSQNLRHKIMDGVIYYLANQHLLL
jgi:hypothetical protein